MSALVYVLIVTFNSQIQFYLLQLTSNDVLVQEAERDMLNSRKPENACLCLGNGKIHFTYPRLPHTPTVDTAMVPDNGLDVIMTLGSQSLGHCQGHSTSTDNPTAVEDWVSRCTLLCPLDLNEQSPLAMQVHSHFKNSY